MVKIGETSLIVNLKNISRPRHGEDPLNRSLRLVNNTTYRIAGDKEDCFLVRVPKIFKSSEVVATVSLRIARPVLL
jgi:hypothetical protein